MNPYSFDEDGVCCASKPGYAVKRPSGLPDNLWEQLASQVASALNEEGRAYEGHEGCGRRLFQECVSRGAGPGHVLQWLKDKLDDNVVPIRHNSMLYEYPNDVFVLFDGTDDGSSIIGAYRSLKIAQERQAFYARMENEGPGPNDPVGFSNSQALQDVLKKAWWKGYENGNSQATMGHSAGYQDADCEADTLALAHPRSRPKEAL